jgi:hypothetical protein
MMEYKALNQGEIRLILLEPGKDDDVVKLSLLQSLKLDDVPAYYGLSYTWGDPNDTQAILVNDCGVPITRNLASCLWHLRQTITKSDPTYLWIDAICINQNDSDEKNRQILLMRKIYQHATCTIVWLGPESADTQYALELMQACVGP